jgi:hypothetical protein
VTYFYDCEQKEKNAVMFDQIQKNEELAMFIAMRNNLGSSMLLMF